MKRDEHRERFDLSPLDPFADAARADRFVRAVLDRSAPELARRRSGRTGATSVFAVLAGWARPALAAAVLAALASVAALRLERAEADADAGVIEALAVPAPVDDWLVDERPPATADLILTLERGTPW